MSTIESVIMWAALFAVPEVTLAPVHDGHTSQDAAQRLRHALLTEMPGTDRERA